MRKLFFLLLSVGLSTALATAQGIEFQDHNSKWADALAKAKAQNKSIFVDAYTTWCGPCKNMSKKIFTQKEVGDFFNAKFICVKMDMESGEGPEMAKRESVAMYPTYLFYSPDGQLVHRAVGYMEAGVFIEEGKNALDPAKQFSAMERRYSGGDRNPQFLYDYAFACQKVGNGKEGDVAAAYLKTVDKKDLSNEKNVKVIAQMISDPSNEYFQYMATHRDSFDKTYTKAAMDQHILESVYNSAAKICMDHNGTIPVKDIEKLFDQYFPGKGKQITGKFCVDYYRYTEKWDDYAKSAEAYINDNKDLSATELNMIAWACYEKIDNKSILKKALGWAKLSLKKETGYYNMDTYAALNYKLGNMREARKSANKAIELAKKEGADYTATEQLLQKMK